MEEIKLNGNNKLPKYWVVRCPKKRNKNHKMFLNTVIRYMDSIIGERWKGDSYGEYYGYDGSNEFKGTNIHSEMDSFINNPTLLTLQEFIDCFKEDVVTTSDELPNEFVIQCATKEETNIAANYYKEGKSGAENWSYWPYVISYDSDKNRSDMLFIKIPNRFNHLPVLTFSKWQELVSSKTPEFVLPEKWCVRVTSVNDYKEHALSKGYDLSHHWIESFEGKEYYYYSEEHWANPAFVSNVKNAEGFTTITLEQFKKYVLKQTDEVMSKECEIEEFKVPEKWYIRGTKESGIWFNEEGFYKDSNVCFNFPSYCYYDPAPDFIHWECDNTPPSGYTEITFEQFINYIYNSTNKTMKEFQIKGTTNLKEAFVKEAGLDVYSVDTVSTFMTLVPGRKHNQVQGSVNTGNSIKYEVFNLPTQWDEALAYVKKYYTALEYKILYFGELKLTIKGGEDFATTRYGNISKAEIQKVLKLFNTKMSICGYDLKIEDVDDIRLEFGCQNGTIGEAKAILEAFNTK